MAVIMRVGMIVVVIMVVILAMLFEMLVVMLVRMVVPATASAAAASLFLMRRVVLRFQIQHFVMVLVGMIVAAAAGMVMVMIMMVVVMTMVVIVAVMMVAMPTLIIRAALGLEGPLHRVHRAAEAPQHFDEDVIVFDVNRIRRHFRRRVAVTDMPGRLHQTRRIFGADFDELLRRGLHGDEAAILELQRIAIVEHSGLVEIEQEFSSRRALERHTAAMAALMIQRDGVDHLVGLHGGFADELNGAKHGKPL